MTTFYCVLDQVAFPDCNPPCGDRSETITGENLIGISNSWVVHQYWSTIEHDKAVYEYVRS